MDEVQPPLKGEVVCEADRRGSDTQSNIGGNDNVLPNWGIQRESELDEFISYIDNPPKMTPEIETMIERDKKILSGEFCRACGYCMPCPAGIEINTCARMSLMLRRAPTDKQLTPEMQEKMKKIEDGLHCNKCKSKCPYGLDTPTLLAKTTRTINASSPVRLM